MDPRAKVFDLVVIGGGPGGYPAAIAASQQGASVALIERAELGGTCLNRGCIPTKTLLTHADLLREIRHADQFGIEVGPVRFAYEKMVERKNEVVGGIRKGLEGLIGQNGITIIRGDARFIGTREVKVIGQDACTVRGESIVIATGSEPLEIPAFPFDGKRIYSSTSILEMRELPKRLAIVGGGYIGCEFASLFAELEVEVSIFEALPEILAFQTQAVRHQLLEYYQKMGVQVFGEVFVEKMESKKNLVVHLKGGASYEVDAALVSVGRSYNTANLDLGQAGIAVGQKGEIPVNAYMETEVPGIYAVGDVTGVCLLAHVATHQGVVAAENALGARAEVDYRAVPAVIFTNPEIASVGLMPEEASYASVVQFPFSALGKSQASGHGEGFVQIVYEPSTEKILGAQVVGYEAATLIAEMTLAIQNELTLECITETIHAHPTIAESWHEAAMMARGTPLHLPPKRRRRESATL